MKDKKLTNQNLSGEIKVITLIQNVAKRQVILLRDKFNIGYNFILFLSLK